MPYVYMARCRDGTYYTGWALDYEERIKRHNNGTGARYTRARRPVVLVYLEEYPEKRQAQQREAALRKFSRSRKEELIENANIIRKDHVKRV
jgi:putative endonuclease